ncbi:MAG: Plug domain-containing protein, partial [Candidatus Symbiothrix sp.]|nr:Plug domain-containing protein [Candidatus Symbiothrix sp.]
MKLHVAACILAVFFTGFFSTTYAEDTVSLKDTLSLQEVSVVSATKTEVNRNQIPLNISVINRETIDASTETGILSILSEHVPGLFVTERGVTGYGVNAGSAGLVNIHGVGSGNRVLMLFDGQPNWAGIFGHHLPDAYVASDAERVEV